LDYGYTTNEAERALVGAFIYSLDIAIVTQDWDFPYFRNDQKILITGFKSTKIRFPPEWIKELIPDIFSFKINGKWMNYFPMMLTMCLDMASFLALAEYVPGEFAQYTGPDQKIWNVDNEAEANYLGQLFDSTQSYNLLNYTIRAGRCIDFEESSCTELNYCSWSYSQEYCLFLTDVKLAASWMSSVSLWWTGIPIVLIVAQLLWSQWFIRKYHRHGAIEISKSKYKNLVNEVQFVEPVREKCQILERARISDKPYQNGTSIDIRINGTSAVHYMHNNITKDPRDEVTPMITTRVIW